MTTTLSSPPAGTSPVAAGEPLAETYRRRVSWRRWVLIAVLLGAIVVVAAALGVVRWQRAGAALASVDKTSVVRKSFSIASRFARST